MLPPRHLPRKNASRAVLRGPCGTKCESRETLNMNATKRTRKRPKNTPCSVRLRHPPHRAPSATAARQRCTARGRSMGQQKQDSLDGLGHALIATSLSRSRRPNERSKNDNVATHGRKRNRRRTRFVGSAAMHAMVNVYNRGLRPVKASYEPASRTHEYEHEHEGIGGLRRVKASYEPAIGNEWA